MRLNKSMAGLAGILILAIVLAAVVVPILALADVPQRINYQSYLTDASGNPINGSVTIVFSIYDAPTGGTKLWTETQSVSVNRGWFSVELGKINSFPSNLFDGVERYLEIQVQGEVLTPRQHLVSTPYAMNAGTLDGLDSSAFLLKSGGTMSGSIPGGVIPYPLFTVENVNAELGVAIFAEASGYRCLGVWTYVVGERSVGGHFIALGEDAVGLQAQAQGLNAKAAEFIGDVEIVGHLNVLGGSVTGSANPMQIALLRWYKANTTGITFTVGAYPSALCFDGANIWVATTWGATKLRASDGSVVDISYYDARIDDICFDGQNIWVADSMNNSVAKLKASDGSIIGTYPAGIKPRAICFDGANIWVVNAGQDTVTKLKVSDGSILGTYPAGIGAWDLCFDGHEGRYIWVTDAGSNSVTKLDATSGAQVGNYPVGKWPTALCFDGSHIWVTNRDDNTVTQLATGMNDSGSIVETRQVGPQPDGICFDGTYIWVANFGNNTVTQLNAGGHYEAPETYAIGGGPSGICFDGANIWVANLYDHTVSKL